MTDVIDTPARPAEYAVRPTETRLPQRPTGRGDRPTRREVGVTPVRVTPDLVSLIESW